MIMALMAQSPWITMASRIACAAVTALIYVIARRPRRARRAPGE